MEWGEAIEVNGVRPDWLRDDERCNPFWWDEGWYGVSEGSRVDCVYGWGSVIKMKLPADHPYYTVQAHNAKHGTNFAYWPGGDSAPDDWDGIGVLFLSGVENRQGRLWRWTSDMGRANIIGYTRKPVQKPDEDHVSVKRITESEAYKLIRDHDYDIVKVLDSLGIIHPRTREERFTQETGITVTPDVRAALEWGKEND